MQYLGPSFKKEFSEFFDSLERNEAGVAKFMEPNYKQIYLFEQYTNSDGVFCLDVFLDVFRIVGTNEFDHTAAHVLKYTEEDGIPNLEIAQSESLAELVPPLFISEAGVVLPAMLRSVRERAAYVRELKG